jgi:hypothetical protein
MWPPPFLWHTPTDQCWPGVLRLPSHLSSGRRGIGMPEIWGKLTFRHYCCYHALYDKIWLREENRLGDFARAKEASKPRWDRSSYGCGLITDDVTKLSLTGVKLGTFALEPSPFGVAFDGTNFWGTYNYGGQAAARHGAESWRSGARGPTSPVLVFG